MKASDLTEIVALILEEYPAAEFSDRRLALWFQTFADREAAEVASATVRVLARVKYPPRLAEIMAELESDDAYTLLFRRRRFLQGEEVKRRLTDAELAEVRALESRLYGRLPPDGWKRREVLGDTAPPIAALNRG